MRRLMAVLAALAVWMLAGPATAQSVEPTVRARELAARYVQMMDLPRMVMEQQAAEQAIMTEFMSALAGMANKGPDEPVTPIETFQPDQDLSAMAPYFAIMEEVMIEAVAQTYPEAELEAMVAFHETDIGRSILGRETAFTATAGRLMVARMEDIYASFGMDIQDLMGGQQPVPSTAPTRSMTPMQPSTTWPPQSDEMIQIITAEQWEAEQAAAAAAANADAQDD